MGKGFIIHQLPGTFALAACLLISAVPQALAGKTNLADPTVQKQVMEALGSTSGRTLSSVPTDFPVQLYTSNVQNKIISAFKLPGQSQEVVSVILTTMDSPKQVFDWYQTLLSRTSWAVTVGNKNKDNAMFLKATKSDKRVTLSCIRDFKAPITTVTIQSDKI